MNISMSMSRDEIIGLASRYLSKDEIINFPFNGDLFAILAREIPPDRVLKDDEGWMFSGYGQCLMYSIDEDVKPRGKWLWMHFVSLQEFPPTAELIRLQPPHVAKGSFQTPDRTKEIRFIRIDVSEQSPALPSPKDDNEDNIIQFKKKKS